jgi:hypothetical protein
MGFWVGGGDVGSLGLGLSGSDAAGAGDERHDRSMVSVKGNVFRAASGCGDVRSRASTSDEADFVLRSRGDVRRLRVVVVAILELFDLIELDDVELIQRLEALEDMKVVEVSGGRDEQVAAVRRGFASVSGWVLGTGCVGDEGIKSSSSTACRDGRSAGGAGIDASFITGSTFRSFVGVADARHVFSVVCLVLPGDTEMPRCILEVWAFVVRVLVFFAGNCEGEGCAGELRRSRVSIMPGRGGVFGRSSPMPKFAGRVCDLCIGCFLLLLVTLGGKFSRTGESDFSRIARGAIDALTEMTGDESERSMESIDGPDTGSVG